MQFSSDFRVKQDLDIFVKPMQVCVCVYIRICLSARQTATDVLWREGQLAQTEAESIFYHRWNQCQTHLSSAKCSLNAPYTFYQTWLQHYAAWHKRHTVTSASASIMLYLFMFYHHICFLSPTPRYYTLAFAILWGVFLCDNVRDSSLIWPRSLSICSNSFPRK